MLDLSKVTDVDIRNKLLLELQGAEPGSDRWRIIGASLNSLDVDSFSDTKTYPRPDHPDLKKRRPLEFLLIGVLVSLRTTLENEQYCMDKLLEKCATAQDVIDLGVEELALIIKSAGMAKQKSERIISCLLKINELDEGLLSLKEFGKEKARKYLLSLPGVGPKAADCIMTIGLNFSSMVVDTNVFRMSCFLFGLDINEEFSFSNPKSVAYIKERLDVAIGEDAYLCQIIHTMLLLAGRRVGKKHSVDKCVGKEYCISCNI